MPDQTLMEPTPESPSKTVRWAVSLFFFLCVPLSIWESTVHAGIFVAQEPSATAHNLIANEFLFRGTMLSHLVGTMAFILMVVLLYRTFKPAHPLLAGLMVIPVLAQFPIVFIMETLHFTALMTLKSEARESFSVLQQQEAAYFLLRAYRYTFGADKFIFGLCFVPMGILALKSNLAPRVIGILILLGGIGYLADTSFYLLLPRADYITVQRVKLLSSLSYSIGLLWFLIKGVRAPAIRTTS